MFDPYSLFLLVFKVSRSIKKIFCLEIRIDYSRYLSIQVEIKSFFSYISLLAKQYSDLDPSLSIEFDSVELSRRNCRLHKIGSNRDDNMIERFECKRMKLKRDNKLEAAEYCNPPRIEAIQHKQSRDQNQSTIYHTAYIQSWSVFKKIFN